MWNPPPTTRRRCDDDSHETLSVLKLFMLGYQTCEKRTYFLGLCKTQSDSCSLRAETKSCQPKPLNYSLLLSWLRVKNKGIPLHHSFPFRLRFINIQLRIFSCTSDYEIRNGPLGRKNTGGWREKKSSICLSFHHNSSTLAGFPTCTSFRSLLFPLSADLSIP